METRSTLLFVYGTLKRGERNYFRMRDSELIAEVKTAPHFRAVDRGAHPGLIRDHENGLSVYGELFAVSDRCLAELDEFEGVPGPFVRELIEVDGHEEVWAYYLNTPVPEWAKSGDRWPL